MKFPRIDMKFIFFVGFYCFGIQTICNILIFFINLRFTFFWSAIATWAGIIFSFALTYFFWYSFRGMSSNVSTGNSSVADQETIDLIKDFKKEAKE